MEFLPPSLAPRCFFLVSVSLFLIFLSVILRMCLALYCPRQLNNTLNMIHEEGTTHYRIHAPFLQMVQIGHNLRSNEAHLSLSNHEYTPTGLSALFLCLSVICCPPHPVSPPSFHHDSYTKNNNSHRTLWIILPYVSSRRTSSHHHMDTHHSPSLTSHEHIPLVLAYITRTSH